MTTKTELKPCPFCGSYDLDYSDAPMVDCLACGASGGSSDSMIDGLTKWNTRPTLWTTVTEDKETWPEEDRIVLIDNQYPNHECTQQAYVSCGIWRWVNDFKIDNHTMKYIKRWVYVDKLLECN